MARAKSGEHNVVGGATGAEKPLAINSAAGPDGVNCPAAGAFIKNTGPSSAKNIKTPMGGDKKDSVGNASCFDPNNYESSAC